MARRAGTDKRISERLSAGNGRRACSSKSRLLLWSMAARVLPQSGVTRPARAAMDQRSSLDFEEHARSPYPALSLSLMRLSVPARLAIAALLSLLLWGAIYWALA